jgi:hypothetical protein
MNNLTPQPIGKNPLNGQFLPGNTLSKGLTNSGRPLKWTHERILEEARLLLEFAQKSDSLVLAEHYGERGYGYQDASDFDSVPEYAEARKISKAIIGARREKEGLKGNLDSAIVRMTIPNYDTEHRSMLREQAQKIDINQSKEGLQISIVSYTSSDN